ncbi:MAG TPA: hypothetical protein VEI53_08265 [Ktedonobacteraceae bacterium]|nr:hypothetical protein [Ktedonobacteraceae bacterium]
MSDNITVQHTTPVSSHEYATDSGRALTTTGLAGGVVILADLLSFPLWMFSMRVTGASNDILDQAEGILWLSFLLTPICCAGAYWFALFRLRHVKAIRAFIETFVFSLLYWLAMPFVLGAGSYVLQTLQLLNQSTALSPGSVATPNLGATLTFIAHAPGLILYMVLLALCASGIGLGAALFFASWDRVREAQLPGHGWLEIVLVPGSAIVATLLSGLAFVYLIMLSLLPILAAVLATIAAWTTYRTLLHAGLAKPSST